MKQRIAFLINPVSGTQKSDALQDLVANMARDRGIECTIHHTNALGQYPELEQDIFAGKITDVVVAGGDGTISAAAAALRHTGVRFGIIPRGSGNGLAFAAGIPKDPVKAMEIVFAGNAGVVDGFLLNGQFSCMLSGIGFDATVAHDFARQKKRGLWSYVKVSAKNFFGAKPYRFTIETSQGSFNTEAFFISLANANQFGNQFTIAPKARLNDGLIDVVVVQRMNKLQLLIAVMHQLKYGDVREDIFRKRGILYFQADHLRIANPEMACLHIDGDPKETAPFFDVTVVKNAFLLLKP